MKPALLIDFDGTLCHDKFWRSLPTETLEKIKIFEFGGSGIAQKWMRGEHTSEEVNQSIAKEIGMPYAELWNIFVDNCSSMQVSAEVLEKINSLRVRYHTVLLTDNMDSFDRFTVPALNLQNYFDLIINSYTEKRGKNDDEGKLMLDVLQRVGSEAKESYLLDNSESSCNIFTVLGGTSFLVTSEQNLKYWLDKEFDD
jgi:FMN phosphatase YigB (HAD superfamily)